MSEVQTLFCFNLMQAIPAVEIEWCSPRTTNPTAGARSLRTTGQPPRSQTAPRATAGSSSSEGLAAGSRNRSYWASQEAGGAPVTKPEKSRGKNPKEARVHFRKEDLTEHSACCARWAPPRARASPPAARLPRSTWSTRCARPPGRSRPGSVGLDEAPPRPPRVVRVAARGEAPGRPARRDPRAHGRGTLPPQLAGARGDPVPPRDDCTNRGLTRPQPYNPRLTRLPRIALI